MEVKICSGCKKMFQYISGPTLCPRCRKLEEEYFQKVKNYLRENPGANMYEINEATEVSMTLIEKFLKQGRLQVTADSPICLTCERCGKRITTGRYCTTCKKEVTDEIETVKRNLRATLVEKDDEKARMRFLNQKK